MSTTNNNAPFHVGQHIAAAHNSRMGYFKKGTNFTVKSDYICPSCGHQFVNIGKPSTDQSPVLPCHCGHFTPAFDHFLYHDHLFFAPINPSYSNATQSILEQFRKDEAVKDKCDSPVKEIINQ